MTDISHTLQAKADQLNADDIAGQSIIVQIVDARLVRDEKQPIICDISGGWKPWRPCLTVRRLLSRAMGMDLAGWVGRWVELYCDPTVRYGGQEVGGIRIRAVSGIPEPFTMRLSYTRGKKKPWRVIPLQTPQPPSLGDVLRSTGVTLGQLDDHLISKGKPPVAQMDDSQLAAIARWLASNAGKVIGGAS